MNRPIVQASIYHSLHTDDACATPPNGLSGTYLDGAIVLQKLSKIIAVG